MIGRLAPAFQDLDRPAFLDRQLAKQLQQHRL
jgi:hypothetical protein